MYFKHPIIEIYAKITDDVIVKAGYNLSMIALYKKESKDYDQEKRNISLDWDPCYSFEFNNVYLQTLKNLQNHADVTNNQVNC
jgi:hypothetical protein